MNEVINYTLYPFQTEILGFSFFFTDKMIYIRSIIISHSNYLNTFVIG